MTGRQDAPFEQKLLLDIAALEKPETHLPLTSKGDAVVTLSEPRAGLGAEIWKRAVTTDFRSARPELFEGDHFWAAI